MGMLRPEISVLYHNKLLEDLASEKTPSYRGNSDMDIVKSYSILDDIRPYKIKDNYFNNDSYLRKDDPINSLLPLVPSAVKSYSLLEKEVIGSCYVKRG